MARFYNNVGNTGKNTAGVAKNRTGDVIEFKRIKGGDNITVVETESTIIISGSKVAAAGDYDASQIDNDSSVSGAFVDDALDTLSSSLTVVSASAVVNSLLFIAVKTAHYSASVGEFVPFDLVTAAAGVTCSLPNITLVDAQKRIGIKMATLASGSTIEVAASGTQLIDGLETVKLTSDHESVIVQSDGSSTWYRIS